MKDLTHIKSETLAKEVNALFGAYEEDIRTHGIIRDVTMGEVPEVIIEGMQAMGGQYITGMLPFVRLTVHPNNGITITHPKWEAEGSGEASIPKWQQHQFKLALDLAILVNHEINW